MGELAYLGERQMQVKCTILSSFVSKYTKIKNILPSKTNKA